LPRRKARVIGRDADLEAIANQLTAQRFVSIVGSGGVGKTTVAAAIVRQISPEFEGNVVFLDLGMLNDPTLVVGALATAVGVAVASRPCSASFPYSRTRFRSMTSRPSSRDRTRPIRQNYSREWPS
jgi:predicted ATPase